MKLLSKRSRLLPRVFMVAAALSASVAVANNVLKGEQHHCDGEQCAERQQQQPQKNETDVTAASNVTTTTVIHATTTSEVAVPPRPAPPNSNTPSQQQQSQCLLYMAPSTIENSNAGLGIFTVEGKQRGDFLLLQHQQSALGGGGDEVIPVHLDLMLEQQHADSSLTPRVAEAAVELLRDYTWDSSRLGLLNNADDDADGGSVSSREAFAPGLESLMNSHLAAANSGPVVVARNISNTVAAKTTAAAATTRTTVVLQTVALATIPAGGEVFGYYGDHWFAARHFLSMDQNQQQHMSLTQDYEAAEQISKLAYEIMQKLRLQTAAQTDLWQMVREWKQTDVEVGDSNRIWNALPVSLEDLRQVAVNSMSAYHQAVKPDLQQDTAARCVDSIRVERRGSSSSTKSRAYAARDFAAGSVMTGSPLLHLVDGTKLLRMPDGSSQLLQQHCFGHDESTLLLCPYAPGVTAIRPAATISAAGSTANSNKHNVRVQWAPDGQLHHRDAVLKDPAQALLQYRMPVTALDYVAVTDIRAGDELVFNFGHGSSDRSNKQGENADKKHHAFLEHASYWNHPTAVGAIILRTQSEQVNSNPYPATVAMQCHAAVLDLQTKASMTLDWTDANAALPCQVTERYVDPTTAYVTYAVRVFSQGTWHGIGGVPRSYIRFVDVPTPVKAIMLPDEIFPRAWRNIISRDSSSGATASAASETGDETQDNTR